LGTNAKTCPDSRAILGPLGTNNNINNNTGGPRKADHVSLWGKRATCTEHFIPLPCFTYLKKIKLRKKITKLLELYANSTHMDKIVRMSK